MFSLQASERGYTVLPSNPPARYMVLFGPGNIASWMVGVRVSMPPEAPHRAAGPEWVGWISDQNLFVKSKACNARSAFACGAEGNNGACIPKRRRAQHCLIPCLQLRRKRAGCEVEQGYRSTNKNITHLLAAMSTPEIAELRPGGVRSRFAGGEGLDHVRVFMSNLQGVQGFKLLPQ